MKSFNSVLAEVKKAGEDFEWYPTTKEILMDLNWDMRRLSGNVKICDVGAGDGNIFKILDKLNTTVRGEHNYRYYTKYAIEKSQVLINKMAADVFVVGTDFHHQSFIDKQMDVIFCNPPYLEFKEWTIRLIKESNCTELYLVIPERWKNSEEIQDAIKARGGVQAKVGSYSFQDSEYRKARAEVDLIRISYETRSYHSKDLVKDPFDLWFDETFNIQAETKESSAYQETEARKAKISSIVDRSKLVDNLVGFYTEELSLLMSNYKAVELLNAAILKELNVNIAGLKAGLKLKISGLKNLYWRELFNNLEAITSRLTLKSREELLKTLTSHTTVDFTHENIYSIVIWAVKNANNYLDSQLLGLYEELTATKNIIGYKSNKHMIDDTWRNCSRWDIKKKAHHYTLDYRCVLQLYAAISGGYSYEQLGNLNIKAHDVISDIFTIAKNLGFDVVGDSKNREWESGKKQLFYTSDGVLFAEIKAYKNGNIHYKLNQNFMKKFNVEAGRLNGWIKSPKDAAEELELSIQEAQAYFKSNTKLLSSNIKLIKC